MEPSTRYSPNTLTEPLVTVLITAYNTPAGFLQEAVRSALDQDVDGMEILVVDDGSQPSLDRYLTRFRDPRLVYRAISHMGPPHALRAGVAMARGRFVTILDHDDRLTPGSLRTRLERIQAEHCGLVYGNIEWISVDGRILGRRVFPAVKTVTRLIRAGLLSPVGPVKHSAILMDREVVLDQGNYDPTLASEYDLDLILKIARAAGFCRVPDFVVQYRIHPGNYSASPDFRMRQIRCRWRLIDRFLSGRCRRTTAKAFAAVILLLKALWLLLSYRRPRALLNRAGRIPAKKNDGTYTN
ncbi:MAG: glycosyltransferase [Acidobacteriota bacterium]|jgi:glycosyltransferase involved in cell wall biosynthesis|nr:glycosyltransferase [Acidobacteriota bacterium]